MSTMELSSNDGTIVDQRIPFKFEKLPPELRLHIWNLSAEPRMVHIRRRWSEETAYDMPLRLLRVAAPPVALSVNQESRQELLKHYPLLFKDRTGCRIRFNSAIDTLYLDKNLGFVRTHPNTYNKVWDNISAKVRNLAIDNGLFEHDSASKYFNLDHPELGNQWPFMYFEGVETITIVYDLDRTNLRGPLLFKASSLKIQPSGVCESCSTWRAQQTYDGPCWQWCWHVWWMKTNDRIPIKVRQSPETEFRTAMRY
ncbi:hypothetical protein BDZ45DRAFT_782583 [Acephala macrosclerotiorum]|nr:hypothetical protein BDZ45DRAFT_782583 [Acephala macrosclerotiorum]